MDGLISHFFAEHVFATIGGIALLLFMFTRGGGGILGSWIVRILLFVMLAVWIWIAAMSYLDSLWRGAKQEVAEVQREVSGYTPIG